MTPQTFAEQLAEQGLTIPPGETALRHRDLVPMYNAVVTLGNAALPSTEARIAVARAKRALKPAIDDYHDERQRITGSHRDTDASTAEGEQIKYRDPIGMTIELQELDRLIVSVKLPARIKPSYLPTNSKAKPNAEDGLGNIIADLGLLYRIEDDADDE